MVSLPDFQQDTLVDALEDERSPLLNRALCNYNCGSVFKIVSAAAALEAGVPLNESYTCKGSINVGGIPFHCHNRCLLYTSCGGNITTRVLRVRMNFCL